MKKYIKTIVGAVMAIMLLFAFAGCGGDAAQEKTPADEAVAALETVFNALQGADMEAIKEISGGEDVFAEATETLGSDEETQAILEAMFSNFQYTMGTPEQIDEENVNVPVTVSNADMTKAVSTWFTDLMEFAMSNPDVANDEEQLQAKTVELLKEAVSKTVEGEDGIITTDVTIPMVLEDGQWTIGDNTTDDVMDAILGGFPSAVSSLTGGQGEN